MGGYPPPPEQQRKLPTEDRQPIHPLDEAPLGIGVVSFAPNQGGERASRGRRAQLHHRHAAM